MARYERYATNTAYARSEMPADRAIAACLASARSSPDNRHAANGLSGQKPVQAVTF